MRSQHPRPVRQAGRVVRLAVAAAILAVGLVANPVAAAPGGQSDFAGVRAATAAYHDLSVALADGYGLLPGCFDDPTGGMGIHYVKGALVDGSIDPTTPEALVYEPLAGGDLRLVAVEYVVVKDAWDTAHPGETPTLFGAPFAPVGVPNEFGVPFPFYELHVWLWQPNPNGMFDEWNPMVSCAAAG